MPHIIYNWLARLFSFFVKKKKNSPALNGNMAAERCPRGFLWRRPGGRDRGLGPPTQSCPCCPAPAPPPPLRHAPASRPPPPGPPSTTPRRRRPSDDPRPRFCRLGRRLSMTRAPFCSGSNRASLPASGEPFGYHRLGWKRRGTNSIPEFSAYICKIRADTVTPIPAAYACIW